MTTTKVSYELRKNGRLRYVGTSENDCLIWLHKHTPYSWHHAFRYERWRITPVNMEVESNAKV